MNPGKACVLLPIDLRSQTRRMSQPGGASLEVANLLESLGFRSMCVDYSDGNSNITKVTPSLALFIGYNCERQL